MVSDLEHVSSILRRLYRYYAGHARSCIRISAENPEAKASIEHRIETAKWRAKRDAVRKVAENLSITLEEDKP